MNLSNIYLAQTPSTTVTPPSETLSSVLVNHDSGTVTFIIRANDELAKIRFSDVLNQVGPTIARLLTYAEGWDSHGGSRISPEAAEVVLQILLETSDQWPAGPAIVPGSDGGLQIEWHMSAGEIEIEVSPSRRAAVYFRAVNGDEWEAPLEKVQEDLPGLLSTLRTS